MPREIRTPPHDSALSNEEILQLANQDGPVNWRIVFEVQVPTERGQLPGQYRHEWRRLKETNLSLKSDSPSIVWRAITAVAKTIRETFHVEDSKR